MRCGIIHEGDCTQIYLQLKLLLTEIGDIQQVTIKKGIYIYYMYLHKRVWTRSYSQINFNSSAFLAVNGAFSRSRSSILAMLKFSSATYCSLIRRLTGDRVKRVSSSSLLLLLLLDGGGGAVDGAAVLFLDPGAGVDCELCLGVASFGAASFGVTGFGLGDRKSVV